MIKYLSGEVMTAWLKKSWNHWKYLHWEVIKACKSNAFMTSSTCTSNVSWLPPAGIPYDDHYFLTDPKEFIYNFFPLQLEWQLQEVMKSLEIPSLRSHQSMEMLATGGPRMHWNTCLGKSWNIGSTCRGSHEGIGFTCFEKSYSKTMEVPTGGGPWKLWKYLPGEVRKALEIHSPCQRRVWSIGSTYLEGYECNGSTYLER